MTWAWFLGLSLGLFLSGFSCLEWRALRRGTPTLSRSIWNWSQSWPALPFVTGLCVGMLAGHWWWPLNVVPVDQVVGSRQFVTCILPLNVVCH